MEYIKLDAYAKFRDHYINNKKVMMVPFMPPDNWWLKKSPCQIVLKLLPFKDPQNRPGLVPWKKSWIAGNYNNYNIIS